MFWPSADERITGDNGAKTANTLHVGIFGIRPTVPDLSASTDEVQEVRLVNTVAEVTSYFAKQAFKMADNISQSGVMCQRLVTTPLLQEIALWKHHGSVG